VRASCGEAALAGSCSDERTEEWCRERYRRWLEERGRRLFGQELEHGDEAGAPGFEAGG
jgi:hypothetical protein